MASLAGASSPGRGAWASGAVKASGIQGIRTSFVTLRIAHDTDKPTPSTQLRPQDVGAPQKVVQTRMGPWQHALPRVIVRLNNALKVRFSATMGHEPEVEVALV